MCAISSLTSTFAISSPDEFLYIYYVQSGIPGTAGRPYGRSANQAMRTNDAMHHSATGDVQLGPSSMIFEFRPPASIRGNTVNLLSEE